MIKRKTKQGRPKKDFPGSIYKPASTNYLYIKYRSVRHATGLPDSPENRKIAKEILMMMYRIEKGIVPPDLINIKPKVKQITFLEAFSDFEKEKNVRFKEATRTVYLTSFNHIIKNTGFLQKNLSTDNIREALVTFQNTRLSRMTDNSRRSHIKNFRVFFNWASKRYKIEYFNPMEFAPAKTVKPVKTYSRDEYSTLLEYWNQKDREFGLLLEFMLLTGFRIGETLALQWSQVKSKHIEVPNKINNNVIERFPLYEQLNVVLDELKTLPNGGKVFRWAVGSKSSLLGWLNKSMEECGIKKDGRAFHVFRKTFSSKLIEANVNLAVTKELMRHKDVNVTLEHYTQIKDETQIEALNSLTKY